MMNIAYHYFKVAQSSQPTPKLGRKPPGPQLVYVFRGHLIAVCLSPIPSMMTAVIGIPGNLPDLARFSCSLWAHHRTVAYILPTNTVVIRS